MRASPSAGRPHPSCGAPTVASATGRTAPVALSRRRLLTASACCWVRHAAGQTPAAPGCVRLVVRAGEARRVVEGTIVVEAGDGGLLLELADQRYEILQPEAIVSREPLDTLDPAATPRELGQRILAELPAGFDLHLTRHYVVCFDTSRDYARWAASLFERLHDAFQNYWSRAGLAVTAPTRPLIVLAFAQRRQYEDYAVRDLGAAADRIVGYYNLMSNRVATYDLTGSEGLAAEAPRAARRGPAEILAQPEAAGLVSTLVHEATHQMAFNGGLHARLAPVPVWVSEGIATYFETPDLRSRSGWRGIGVVNRHRLDRFRRVYRPGDLEGLVQADDRFRDVATAADSYAVAWALTWFLLETRREQFAGYLGTLARKAPLAPDAPDRRLEEFAAAFGTGPAALEPALQRHMARVEQRAP
jgi:hypothetical protein